MTIDELARRTETTSRTIRSYQERGVLPPPRLVGRTGYYGDGHVARLRHIAEMLERGFSLAAIRELFDAWERGYGLADVLGFEQALDAAWADEASRVMTRDELAAEFGLDDETLAGSIGLGLIAPEGEGFRVESSSLLHAGRQLIAAGIPARALIAEAGLLRADLERVAGRWVALFVEHVWTPYVEHGMRPEDLRSISDAVNRLRPLALFTVQPMLAQAMEQHVAALAADTLGSVPRGAKAGHIGA